MVDWIGFLSSSLITFRELVPLSSSVFVWVPDHSFVSILTFVSVVFLLVSVILLFSSVWFDVLCSFELWIDFDSDFLEFWLDDEQLFDL